MPKKRPVWGTFWREPDGFFGLKVNGRKKYVPTVDDLLDELEKEIRKFLR